MLRILAFALLLGPALFAGPRVVLDATFPEKLRGPLQELADEIAPLVYDRFAAEPPLDLPIVCFYRKGLPITQLDDWTNPTTIRIGLNVSDAYYAQFAFQLGHELGHVMMDPRRSNGIIETICFALSFEVLDALHEKFSSTPPGANPIFTRFAPHFREYREDTEKSTLAAFPADLRLAVKENRWAEVQQYLRDHSAEQLQTSQREIESDRGHVIQALGAMALRSGPIAWRDFVDLGACTNPPPDQSPAHADLPLMPNCIQRLSDTLCRAGAGCR